MLCARHAPKQPAAPAALQLVICVSHTGSRGQVGYNHQHAYKGCCRRSCWCCSVLWYAAVNHGVSCNATGDVLDCLKVLREQELRRHTAAKAAGAGAEAGAGYQLRFCLVRQHHWRALEDSTTTAAWCEGAIAMGAAAATDGWWRHTHPRTLGFGISFFIPAYLPQPDTPCDRSCFHCLTLSLKQKLSASLAASHATLTPAICMLRMP